MLKHMHSVTVIMLAFALVLSGCKTVATPTVDPVAVITQAAQTAQAMLTQAALLTPSATITPTPTQTSTPQPPTATFTATLATPLASATNTPQSSTDKAQFVDQSPADGTAVAPGADFTVTWRIKNVGVSTWSTLYRMRFFAGQPMGTINSVALANAVKTNEEITVSVPMKAPTTPGEYTTIWVLSNAQDANFFNVFIRIVVGTPAATATPTGAATATTPTVTSTP